MKENLKPYAYKLREDNDTSRRIKSDRVLFVERSGELHVLARLSTKGAKPKRDQVLIGRRSQ